MERPHFDIVASGARMRAIRQERKISVKQVMEYMGFESTQAVYKWEAGKCFPQADNLIALAILYRVSPMELLVEEDLVPSSSHIWGNPAKCGMEEKVHRKSSMIYITGDTHGDFTRFSAKRLRRTGMELTKEDYIIICGDFGLCWACLLYTSPSLRD